MISRYAINEIENIWSDQNKYKTWLDVEIAVCEAWEKLGVIPNDDVVRIKRNAKVDFKRMLEIEIETKHDVVAFTRMISESLGDERKWIHLGITSTDIVDTAQNIMIKKSNIMIQSVTEELMETLKHKVAETKNILIMGRTHGMWGEPISLGLKFALWYDELKNQLVRFDLARKQVEVGKISGSMGNYANIELEIEDYVTEKFNLNEQSISTQVTQRDRHAFLISVIANIASTLEKVSTEIRLLQQSEISEMSEGFGKKQKGSSSMPHKKNPISSENIAGLARYIRSFTTMGFENNNLWHERDISHSSNERIVFPDMYNAIYYIVTRMNDTIKSLYINIDKIDQHIKETNNVFYSQRVLTYLLMKTKNISREEIYDFIQTCSIECINTSTDFQEILIKNGVDEYISIHELNELFDINFFNRTTNNIFAKVFD